MIHETIFADFHTRLRAFIGHSDFDSFDEAGFATLAKTLFELQYETLPLLCSLCKQRGVTPQNLRDWRDIPAIPTSAFKDCDITSLSPEKRKHVFHSSGTTLQKPGRHFHDDDSLATYEASLKPSFAHYFLDDKSKMDLLALTPPPSLALHSSLAHMFGAVAPMFTKTFFTGKIDPDGAWILDLESTINHLQNAVDENRPIAIVGAAFSFVYLFDYCLEKNKRWQLPAGSRVMETGGYKGRSRVLSKKELYDLIDLCLNIAPSRIVSEYGMSELSSQAYDIWIASPSQLSRIFNFPPWARVQIVSAETQAQVDDGEIGLIRIFDLANVRSCLAIQTEDLAIRRGNGFELIGRAPHAEPRGCSLMPS